MGHAEQIKAGVRTWACLGDSLGAGGGEACRWRCRAPLGCAHAPARGSLQVQAMVSQLMYMCVPTALPWAAQDASMRLLAPLRLRLHLLEDACNLLDVSPWCTPALRC